MRLLSSNGELVRGRCRATNLCAYCAKLAAVENAELLALDALAGSAPQLWAVLTTRTATLDTARFYESRRMVLRALKRRWPEAEVAALVEFTTGYGSGAGGRRRPHWNLLIKGVPASALEEAAAVIRRVWCEREDARPEAQHVGEISDAGGLLRYIALHFQKDSQRPPDGWRGHRFLKSRGYLSQSTPEARAAARESLAFKRELWRAIRAGLTGLEAERAAREARELAAATSWRLIDVGRSLMASGSGVRAGDAAKSSAASIARPPRPETELAALPGGPLRDDTPEAASRGPGGVSARQRVAAAVLLRPDPGVPAAQRHGEKGAARSPEPVPRR